VVDRSAFTSLEDYLRLCSAFLGYAENIQPTRIISPSHPNYVFFQYGQDYGHKITRPLNSGLFLEKATIFRSAFDRFTALLGDLREAGTGDALGAVQVDYLASNEINRVIYTLQQSIGCIGDSFDNPNQSRKRIGQLFENLVKLVIQEVGIECEPRTINLPIPDFPGMTMPYELDLVFSRRQVIIASETSVLQPFEVVGSVKTTSKDRIDKIFLDKFLLGKLLGREVPVVAVFLHDVQRAVRGNSIFGVNSTFKTNHFLGYSVALNRLDGVYYVDPRPEMVTNERLRREIASFQRFLVHDLWLLTT
jgi:hypothetical protein